MEIKDEKIKVQKYKGFSIGNLFKNFNKNGIAFPNVIKLKITLKIKPPTIIKNPAKIDSNKIRSLENLCILYLNNCEYVRIKYPVIVAIRNKL